MENGLNAVLVAMLVRRALTIQKHQFCQYQVRAVVGLGDMAKKFKSQFFSERLANSRFLKSSYYALSQSLDFVLGVY